MTAGWFDAWRSDGGPALHADPNRTHVTVDTPELFICIAFVTLFVAFLIIVPGEYRNFIFGISFRRGVLHSIGLHLSDLGTGRGEGRLMSR